MGKTRNYWKLKITRETVKKAKELTKQGFGYKHITKELKFSAGTYRRMQNVKFDYDEYLNYANFEKEAYGYNKCLEIAKKEGYSNVAQYIAENGNKELIKLHKNEKTI